jgi:hypothetical protein
MGFWLSENAIHGTTSAALFRFTIGRCIGRCAGFGSVEELQIGFDTEKSTRGDAEGHLR